MRRSAWKEETPLIDPSRLVFLDETGAKTNMTRLYGRAPSCERVIGRVPSGRWNTTTLIAAVRKDGPIAPMMLEGAIDGEAFTLYVERFLAPILRKGDIVIWDNLSSHNAAAARRAIEAAGATLLPLPPYSPDLNPIEKMWSKIKAGLRKAAARTAEALMQAVANALDSITREDIKGWFQSCGYTI